MARSGSTERRVTPLGPTRAMLAEGPIVDPATGEVLWVELRRGVVHRTDPDTQIDTILAELGEPVGFVLPGDHHDPRPVVGTPQGIRALDGGTAHPLLVPLPFGGSDIRMNDGARDPAGRVLGGTMVDGVAGRGTLWSFDGSTATALLHDLSISNGIGFPDDGTMLHVDTPTRRIDAYEYDIADGSIGTRRTAFDVSTVAALDGGFPDGLVVTADGGVWLAVWGAGRVVRLAPGLDQVVDVIELPTRHPTSCAVLPDGDLVVSTAREGGDDHPLAGALLRVST